MPIYEYKCKKCGKLFEELVSRAGDKNMPCPECKSSETQKQMSVFGALGASSGELPMPSCGSSCAGSSCAAAGSCPRFA
jgi:putative FmdB family regulatory protein